MLSAKTATANICPESPTALLSKALKVLSQQPLVTPLFLGLHFHELFPQRIVAVNVDQSPAVPQFEQERTKLCIRKHCVGEQLLASGISRVVWPISRWTFISPRQADRSSVPLLDTCCYRPLAEFALKECMAADSWRSFSCLASAIQQSYVFSVQLVGYGGLLFWNSKIMELIFKQKLD